MPLAFVRQDVDGTERRHFAHIGAGGEAVEAAGQDHDPRRPVGVCGIELRGDFAERARAQRVAEVRAMQPDPHDAGGGPVDDDVLHFSFHDA